MRCAELVFALSFLAVASGARFPQAQPPAPVNSHLEGDWVRIDPDGAGSFDGLGASIPPAQLLPGVAAAGAPGGRGRGRGGAAMPQSDGPNPEGVPYIVVAQPCRGAVGGRTPSRRHALLSRPLASQPPAKVGESHR